MNFTDRREMVEVFTGGDVILNETLTEFDESEWETGHNIVFNDTATREIHMVINGRNQTRNSVRLRGFRCVYNCNPVVEDKELEMNFRRWSNASDWESGKIPEEGEDVEIKSGWNMIFDIEESPKLRNLQINGRLTFL